nr:MAG TPA: hypothetical protein [Caudoviricetes sp.]
MRKIQKVGSSSKVFIKITSANEKTYLLCVLVKRS